MAWSQNDVLVHCFVTKAVDVSLVQFPKKIYEDHAAPHLIPKFPCSLEGLNYVRDWFGFPEEFRVNHGICKVLLSPTPDMCGTHGKSITGHPENGAFKTPPFLLIYNQNFLRMFAP